MNGPLSNDTWSVVLTQNSITAHELCAMRAVCRGIRALIANRSSMFWIPVCLREGLRLMTQEEQASQTYDVFLQRNWVLCRQLSSLPPHLNFLIRRAAQRGHEGLLLKTAERVAQSERPDKTQFITQIFQAAAGAGLIQVIRVIKNLEEVLTVKNFEDAFIQSVLNNHVACLEELFYDTIEGSFLEAALYAAAEKGHTACVRYLLTKNPPVDHFTMQFAKFGGFTEIVELLMPYTGDVSMDGHTPRPVESLSDWVALYTRDYLDLTLFTQRQSLSTLSFDFLSQLMQDAFQLPYPHHFEILDILLSHKEITSKLVQEPFFSEHMVEPILKVAHDPAAADMLAVIILNDDLHKAISEYKIPEVNTSLFDLIITESQGRASEILKLRC